MLRVSRQSARNRPAPEPGPRGFATPSLGSPSPVRPVRGPRSDPAELERLRGVRRYDIPESPSDVALARIAGLAARVLDAPMAAITVIGEERISFKACHGFEAQSTDRVPGMCASAILHDGVYLVQDASVDIRTISHPFVTGYPRARFYAAAPLVTKEGHRLGTLNVMDRRPRTITQEQAATLTDLAAVIVGELELRLYAREAADARTEVEKLGHALQLSAIPPALPTIAGLDVAGYYHPAKGGLVICGDFFDVFETRAGTWVMAIGDVCGKGVDAAVMMTSVRRQLRVLADDGSQSPGSVLSRLSDSLVNENHDGRFCTVCYLEVTITEHGARIVMSSGGHPLPVVRRADGSVEDVGETGFLLGVFPGVEHRDSAADLAAGDLLLLYTDGLVEQRGVDRSLSDRALRTALSCCAGPDAVSVLGCIEQAMPQPPGGRVDDTAMLLLRVDARPTINKSTVNKSTLNKSTLNKSTLNKSTLNERIVG